MFGSLGAFVNGNMFMGLFGPEVGLKLPEAHQVVASGGGPFGPAERPMMGYVSLPAGIATGQARRLAARSLEYVGALRPKAQETQEGSARPRALAAFSEIGRCRQGNELFCLGRVVPCLQHGEDESAFAQAGLSDQQ